MLIDACRVGYLDILTGLVTMFFRLEVGHDDLQLGGSAIAARDGDGVIDVLLKLGVRLVTLILLWSSVRPLDRVSTKLNK